MPKILVLQHVAHELLGTLNPLFKKNKFRIKYVNFARDAHQKPKLDSYHGLVVLGGPMNVDETKDFPNLKYEVKLIQEAIKKDIPVLGICLGSQLVAKALGAKVYPNKSKEIGWYNLYLTAEGKKDPVLSKLKKSEKIFQWHGDTFELPDGAVHLAQSSLCKNQAFRYGKKVYAFQFHMEVSQAVIERWLRVPVMQEELDSLKGKVSANKIRLETPHYIDRLEELSQQSFGAFIDLFGQKKQMKRLPSR